jgi:hypothetical protein
VSFLAWWAWSGVGVITFGALFLACAANDNHYSTWTGELLYLVALIGLTASLLGVFLLPFVWNP